MSVTTELERIQTARNTIRDKMVELGLSASTDTLDALADDLENVENRGAVTANVKEGETYTIPKGYHNGGGTVSGVAGGGNYSLQAKTVTPTKKQQEVNEDSGYYGLSSVIVEAIPEAYQNVSSVTAAAADVLANKVIVTSTGAVTTGTMPNNGAVSKTLDTTTTSYTVPKGYHSGSGKVSIVTETKTATPTKSTQDVTPTSGSVLSKVTVEPIPAEYQDVSGVTATAGQVLAGSVFVDAEGTAVTGTMPDNGAISKTLTTASTSYTVPAGYTSGGTVNISTESKTATPTKSKQTISPTSGKVLSSVVVNAIPAAYITTTDATAEAADILSGEIAYVNGSKVTGTMPNKGAVSVNLSVGQTSYTVPAGYHSGAGTVGVTLETKTVTPTKGELLVSPTAGKLLEGVTVNPIPDEYITTSGATAAAAHILYSKTAYANGSLVTGTMANNGAVTKTLDTSTTAYAIPAGYHSGTGRVSITTETKSVTPSTTAQTITPTSGKVLSSVTVAKIPATYVDTSTATAAAGNILSGKTAYVNGSKVTGTMANNGAISKTMDGMTTTSVTIPAGYTSGGTVSLTTAIEEALAAI